jgi:potassium efflux system protein
VDGTTGTVSKIRIRATTIVNWERQELVIPNKTFITGQLIKWTLSGNVNRIVVSGGVGYDSDTRLAMQLMEEVAQEHPNVVADPPFRISFKGFGGTSLTLNMRAFLDNMDARLQTITELHQNLLDRFREANIEIAPNFS